MNEILLDLVNKQRGMEDLSPEEQDLLNRAAIDFATAKRPEPASPRPEAVKKPLRPRKRGKLPAAARAAMSKSEDELEYREHGRPMKPIDIPESPPTFWWRKKK